MDNILNLLTDMFERMKIVDDKVEVDMYVELYQYWNKDEE